MCKPSSNSILEQADEERKKRSETPELDRYLYTHSFTKEFHMEIEMLKHYKILWLKAVEAARELQTGGRYSHLLMIGDSTVIDGIKALIKELDRLNGAR